MKKLLFILVGFLFTSPLISQTEYQQEIICPCMLEYKFPQTFYETAILQGGVYGGIPVLRFKNASIENNVLLCTYEDALATTGLDAPDPGFGFNMAGEIPTNITLTLITDFLNDWEANSKFAKLKILQKGFVLFPICFPEEDQNGRYFGWAGAFYSGNYEGKAITLKRNFEGEARLNSYKNGFIISSTKTGLYTPAANTEGASNPSIKGKETPIPVTKATKKPNTEKKKSDPRKNPKVEEKKEKKQFKRKKIE